MYIRNIHWVFEDRPYIMHFSLACVYNDICLHISQSVSIINVMGYISQYNPYIFWLHHHYPSDTYIIYTYNCMIIITIYIYIQLLYIYISSMSHLISHTIVTFRCTFLIVRLGRFTSKRFEFRGAASVESTRGSSEIEGILWDGSRVELMSSGFHGIFHRNRPGLVMTFTVRHGFSMALIEIDDFPSELNLHLCILDFPWRSVSHNHIVYGFHLGFIGMPGS